MQVYARENTTALFSLFHFLYEKGKRKKKKKQRRARNFLSLPRNVKCHKSGVNYDGNKRYDDGLLWTNFTACSVFHLS